MSCLSLLGEPRYWEMLREVLDSVPVDLGENGEKSGVISLDLLSASAGLDGGARELTQMNLKKKVKARAMARCLRDSAR
jgi:hypothetical protein